MTIFRWIEQEVRPALCDSVEFMYDDMESQSGRCLPIIYQPFDPNNKTHWRDRGACYDYLYSTHGRGKRLLDFGPGDGWPSLIVAPFAREVIGVDGSARRVKVCAENARRLNITNTTFVHVAPGSTLPFEDDSFDGVMAASSIEQTPDPEFTLRDIYRILKPRGRLRMHYESLGYYTGGKEQEIMIDAISLNESVITLYDRHVEEELAIMYRIFVSWNARELMHRLRGAGAALSIDRITTGQLAELRSAITSARMCQLNHPSCATFVSLLQTTGFREVCPTQNGLWAAANLFDNITESERPKTLCDVDELVKPAVKDAVRTPALTGVSGTWEPMITAVK